MILVLAISGGYLAFTALVIWLGRRLKRAVRPDQPVPVALTGKGVAALGDDCGWCGFERGQCTCPRFCGAEHCIRDGGTAPLLTADEQEALERLERQFSDG